MLTGLGAGFRKGLFVLNNSKQKHKKFLNFHQNSLENEIIFARGGGGGAPSERNATLSILTLDLLDLATNFSRLLAKLA